MINILIFSKDRACQLDLCIRSILEKLHLGYRLHVQYTTSDEMFDKGYELLKQKYGHFIKFVKESNFKTTLLEMVSKFENEYCMFLVDDDVFINDVSEDEFCKLFKLYKENTKVATVSFRMNPFIDYCFPAKKKMIIPEFMEETMYLLWAWVDYDSFTCWGYPMAIDTHVYNVKSISALFNRLNYSDVNTLELNMTYNTPKEKPYMISFKETKVYNIQHNFVQEDSRQKSKCAVHTLNEKFLKGAVISTEDIYRLKPTAAHGKLEYKLIGGC